VLAAKESHIKGHSICFLTLPIESNIFPKGSNDKFQEFLKMNDDQQRKAIADVI
jgi:hypothetical protein